MSSIPFPTGHARREPRPSRDPLAETVGRFMVGRASTTDPVAALAQRLDDKGCASGRVTTARMDELSRSFDRLEAKLNAILVAVTATFLSTLVGLVVLALRAPRGMGLPLLGGG